MFWRKLVIVKITCKITPRKEYDYYGVWRRDETHTQPHSWKYLVNVSQRNYLGAKELASANWMYLM